MADSQCPLCHTQLVPRKVAPCHVCGHDANELDHLVRGRHAYTTYRYLGDLEITLCDHCIVDLSSFDPKWFGLRSRRDLGPDRFSLLEALRDPQPAMDKYCPSCNARLAFLRFVQAVRERAA